MSKFLLRDEEQLVGLNKREKLHHHYQDRSSTARSGGQRLIEQYYADVLLLFDNWRETLLIGRLGSNFLAGLTVAAVALPLNVALAVASGLPASAGLIAGAVGGALSALFGGATLQVTGPAAALNVLVFGLVAQFGPVGAATGAIAVGVIQLLFYATRAGGIARFLPESLLAGFTTGVGLKLLDQQIPKLLDIDSPVSELALNLHVPVWLNTVNWIAVLTGLFVMIFMLGLVRFKKFPAAIVGLTIATALSSYLHWDVPVIGTVPSTLPSFSFPELSLLAWANLFAACIPLAILASAESLLSAQAIEKIRPQTKPYGANLEVFGQGVANIGAGMFGGLPVSGVIVRSSVNVQAGGNSRMSSLFHAVLLLIAPLFMATWIGAIPVPALAGLLCIIGYKLIDIATLKHLLRQHKLQVIVFLLAAGGVLSGHLSVGMMLACAVAGLDAWINGRVARKRQIVEHSREANLPPGIRAHLPARRSSPFQNAPTAIFVPQDEDWQSHLDREPVVHPTAFVHPNASIIGHVVLSPRVHVAAEAALRADEGTPFFVGADTNIQDGVVLHALKSQWVKVGEKKWAIYVGERVSLAHQALVHGPSFIGDDTFVGFKAVVHNAIVGSHCSIGIGAIVVGVEIPDGRYVPPGTLVDTNEKAQALPAAEAHHHHFNADVVDVNRGLASAYLGEEVYFPATRVKNLLF